HISGEPIGSSALPEIDLVPNHDVTPSHTPAGCGGAGTGTDDGTPAEPPEPAVVGRDSSDAGAEIDVEESPLPPSLAPPTLVAPGSLWWPPDV
ncbi:hypothetical protein C6A85_67400, partial [Mycobacterium sp. ITM-2017-0098]